MVWTGAMIYDAAVLDLLDWRLGPGQGRRVLLAMPLPLHDAWAAVTLRETLSDCYRLSEHREQDRIRLTLSPGVTWDGADLKLPGEWPETVMLEMRGRQLREIVDHPALPADRVVTRAEIHDDGGFVVRTDRPDPIDIRDDEHLRALRSPTLRGRLGDAIAIRGETRRFLRRHDAQSVITPGGMTAAVSLIAVLAVTVGIIRVLWLAQDVPATHQNPAVSALMIAFMGAIAVVVVLGGLYGLEDFVFGTSSDGHKKITKLIDDMRDDRQR